VKCASPCQQEFEPKRKNQIYVNAEHRRKDSNRRWPVKRQSALPGALRNGPGKLQEAKTSYVTLHGGPSLPSIVRQALTRERRRKFKGDPDSAEMLTAYEVSRLLRISYYTLLEWRKSGEAPPSVVLSPRIIRFPRARLERWIQGRIEPAANRGGLRNARENDSSMH
jgi:predicted DNA-binding transcriptional regulator AlpA